ncbi:MAG: DUF1540 domain-containing protein [Fusobacteriaceae bacterium]
MPMSKIKNCDATKCVYNKDGGCHTYGINVGDDTPICDTYMVGAEKAGMANMGGIGSCKVKACYYNNSLECSAKEIHMHQKRGHVDCTTFRTK